MNAKSILQTHKIIKHYSNDSLGVRYMYVR